MKGLSLRGPALGDALAVPLLLDADSQSTFRAALRGHSLNETPLEELAIADPSFRRLLREVLDTVLNNTRDHLRTIGSWQLRELLPGAVLVPDGCIGVDEISPRLRAILERARWTRWSVLLEQRLSNVIDLPNVGIRTLVELIGVCFERSIDGAIESWVSNHDAGDLVVMLRHERGRSTQPLVEALLEQWSGDGPTLVREAAGRLLKECAPWALEVEPTLRALIEGLGDERSRSLFIRLSLTRARRPALDELATEMAISTTRVREIRDRAEVRARNVLAASTPPLRFLVATLRHRLGALTTNDGVHATLERLGAARSLAGDLLLWLAGPYLEVPDRPGWLAVNPKFVVDRTSACLRTDGGIRRLIDVASELGDLEIPNDQLAPWLRACGAIVVHDSVVHLSGPLADVIERILDAHGVARTLEEITSDLARGARATDPSALATALRGRRFRCATDGALHLIVWDKESRPTAARARSPRRSTKPDLPHDRSRTEANPANQERLWLWVRVDAEVLRGSGAAVPVALVEGLGLAPLTRRTFAGRWGPIVLVYEGTEPTRGSIRPVALAAGAQLDDMLLLGFAPAGDVAVEIRRGAAFVSTADTIAGSAKLFPELSLLSGGPQ